MKDSRLHSFLTLSGTLPFVACALLLLAGTPSLAPFGNLSMVAAVYGFGIISFLCGIHWAMAFYKSDSAPLNLTASSNVVFLVTFLAYVGAGVRLMLSVEVAAFLTLLIIDHRLLGKELISASYFRLRILATATAVVSLIVIMLHSPQ